MAKNRKSTSALIDEYETSGKLTTEEAQALRDSPHWVIPFSDIASYLGGSVIFVGLVWIVVALMQDMSQATIDAALFVATGLTAFLSFTLIKKGGKLATLGESIAAVSTMTFAFAIGLLLDIFNVHDDYILLTASAVALVIGIGLSTRTTFIGTIIIVAATQPFMAAVISEFIPDTPVAALTDFLVSVVQGMSIGARTQLNAYWGSGTLIGLLLAGFWWLFSGPDHPGASLMVKRTAAATATTSLPSTCSAAMP